MDRINRDRAFDAAAAPHVAALAALLAETYADARRRYRRALVLRDSRAGGEAWDTMCRIGRRLRSLSWVLTAGHLADWIACCAAFTRSDDPTCDLEPVRVGLETEGAL